MNTDDKYAALKRAYPNLYNLGAYFDDPEDWGDDGMAPMREWLSFATRDDINQMQDEIIVLRSQNLPPVQEFEDALNYFFEDTDDFRCWLSAIEEQLNQSRKVNDEAQG